MERFYTRKEVVVLLALLCVILWGSAYPGVKTSYKLFGIGPSDTGSTTLLAGIRFSLAGIFTMAFLWVSNRRILLPGRRDLPAIGLTGLIQTGGQYILFYIGVAHLTGVKSSILGATITFFSVILAHFMFRDDKLDGRKIAGCAAGFAGIIIVNMGRGSLDSSFTMQGEGCMLLSAFAAAWGALISKKVSASRNPVMVAGCQMLFGGIILTAAGLFMHGKVNSVSPGAMLLLIYLAGVSAVAFTLWTTLLKYNVSGKITIYNFLIPVFGSALSALFLGEAILTLQNLLALLLVCFGIAAVNYRGRFSELFNRL